MAVFRRDFLAVVVAVSVYLRHVALTMLSVWNDR